MGLVRECTYMHCNDFLGRTEDVQLKEYVVPVTVYVSNELENPRYTKLYVTKETNVSKDVQCPVGRDTRQF